MDIFHRYVLFYDGHPDRGGKVISFNIAQGLAKGDNYAWTEWVPREPGTHQLYVRVLEDPDDRVPRNNIDMLKVVVVPSNK